MTNCSKCFWCRIAFHPKWIWKCKMGRKMVYKNYMNHPKLHGMFCKWYEPYKAEGEEGDADGKAKKCDRCGMFYISLSYEEDRPSYNGLKVYGIATLSFNNHNIKLYDLCQDCAKAFYEFVERGDADGHES